MADTLDIDLAHAVLEKIESNGRKYPPEKYRGRVPI